MAGLTPVPRWLGYLAVVVGLAMNEPALEWAVVPDGSVASTPVSLAILAVQLACVTVGAFILLRRPATRVPVGRLVLAAGSGLVTLFLTFALLDTQAPGLLEVPGVRYFSVKARYVPDSSLVMRPRRPERTLDTRFRGDLYTPGGPVPAVDVPYRATFNERGFRSNSAGPPYRIAVIGDSYVEFGEADSLTLSERIRAVSGLTTYNLGRGWYGPPQYVELLRRHGLDLEPSFALLCFFEGNDVRDVVEYGQWRRGEGYYHFSVIEQHLLKRFAIALMDLASAAWEAVAGSAPAAHGTALLPADDGGRWLRFAYYPEPGPAGERVRRGEWREIRRRLREFRDRSREHGVVPVVVFVPAKLTVYRHRLERPEGTRVREAVRRGPAASPSATAAAMAEVTDELEVSLIDLTGPFRRAADEGRLLYYAADTHWNVAGRTLAARVIARRLAAEWPGRVPMPARSGAGSGP